MKAQETTLQQLIEGVKQFQIPLYQRTYSWWEKEWRRLWDDILEQAEAVSQDPRAATHFLGPVVLSPSPVEPGGGINRSVVVDGQQRLTTLMLALCALRDHLAAEDPQAHDRINELFLINKFKQGLDYYRLVPTQADRNAFFACINATGDAGGDDNIGACYRFFRGVLVDADDPTDPHDLARIETVLLERLAIVEIVTQDEDNVYRIFESLNDTGRRLTQADLIRNYLFMQLPKRGEEVYADYWFPMQKRLGGDLELLFFLDLVLRQGERVKRGDIYRMQKDRLKGYEEAGVEREVASFERRSRFLQRILEPAGEPNQPIRAGFERFRIWGAQTVYPLALRLLEILEQGGATAGEVAQALSYAESFIVRRMLCNIPTNNLNRIFSSMALQLRDDLPVAEAVREALSGPRRFWPTDRELHTAIHTKPFAWYGRSEQRLIVLGRIEECLSEMPLATDADLALTYVMPGQRSVEWLAELAKGEPDDAASDELHNALVHTLGNLTLCTEGKGLSASPTARRQEILERADLALNHDVAAPRHWTAAAIRERADRLAAVAIEIWPGPGTATGEEDNVSGRDWHLLHQALAMLPAGHWTTYGDLAALLGTHPRAVGQHLASVPGIRNPHRVLTRDGTVSQDFHWPSGDDTGDVHNILRSEGVRLDGNRYADPDQRLQTADLARLVGLTAGGGAPQRGPSTLRDLDREASFLRQLGDKQATVQDAVKKLLRFWCELDGAFLAYGKSPETTCYLELAGPPGAGYSYRPFTVYPTGWVEVGFRWLLNKPPFNHHRYRDDFRRRCNEAPGVDLPFSKLEAQPSIRFQVLTDPASLEALLAALRWFVATVDEWTATLG